MIKVLPKLYDILVFRGTPAEIPYSKPLLVGCYISFFILLTGLVRVAEVAWIPAMWKATLFIVVQSLFSLIILQIRGLERRFVQTMLGLLSCQFFIMALFLGPYTLLSLNLQMPSSHAWKIDLMTGLSAILVLSASIWLYLITSFIYEAALELKTLMAGFVALVLLGLQALVFSQLYF